MSRKCTVGISETHLHGVHDGTYRRADRPLDRRVQRTAFAPSRLRAFAPSRSARAATV